MATKTKHETRAITGTEAVADYVLLDRRIKELEEAKAALKPFALEALSQLNNTVELPGYKVTRVTPVELKVDLATLKGRVSRYLFNKLTKRTANLDVIRAYVGAEKLSAAALGAIEYVDGTEQIRITTQ